MVSRVYHDDEEPTLGRFSSRGHSYPLSQDREMYSTQSHGVYSGHRQHMPPHEPRDSEHSPDLDSGSRPRSRIPVACGRCRKRKIKCSGEKGGPCTNCKQAGNHDCAFLRVSSTEAQMKSETSYEYGLPESAASRLNSRMLSYGPQAYGSHAGLPADPYNYRGSSVANYQYPIKSQQYYAMPPFPEFNEDGVDYGLQQASVAELLPSQPLGIPPNYTNSYARSWTPTSQTHFAKNPLFLDQTDSNFNHGNLPYHGNPYPLRTSISPEAKSVSLNPLNTSLPIPIAASADRVLPFPASRPSQGGSYVRNAENFIPTTQASLQYPDYSGRQVRSNHSLPGTEALPNSHTSCLSMSVSSTDSMTSSQMGYNSQQFPINQQQDEKYHHENEAIYHQPHPNGGIYNVDLDPTYGHQTSPQPKRGSHSSQATNTDVLVSSNHGNLVNGYQYVPPPHNDAIYPIPPMSIPHHHSTPAPTLSRRLSNAIAAS